MSAAATDATFAANRSAGRIALSVAVRDGRSRRQDVYEDGPLRVRFPNAGGGELEAVVVNTSGGIAGGDRHHFEISVGERARLSLTTAAAEKVYRAMDAPTVIAVKLAAAAGARLCWLPQPTILFDRVRFDRRFDVELDAQASLLVAEAVIFGRAAMGERVEQGSFIDRWRVRRGGRMCFADTLRLDGALAQKLDEPAVANGAIALATVLAVPGDESMAGAVRAQTFCGEVGVSAWNGLALARLCAKDGADLLRDLAAVVTAFGGKVPRLWLN